MITLRKSRDRGHADFGWLRSAHSFSFGHYFDPRFQGWGNLLVINEDRVAPGKGFGAHGHRDMEILSYVLAGNLAHQDSMGNVVGIPPGDIQRMSAGTGVRHSEFNHAPDQETHFLQIWIEPKVTGMAPGYEQQTVPPEAKRGRLALIASPDGSGVGVTLHADARVYAGEFRGDEEDQLPLREGRKAYVHLVRGRLQLNGVAMEGGDGALVADEPVLRLAQGQDAEVLVFDLAP